MDRFLLKNFLSNLCKIVKNLFKHLSITYYGRLSFLLIKCLWIACSLNAEDFDRKPTIQFMFTFAKNDKIIEVASEKGKDFSASRWYEGNYDKKYEYQS